MNVMTLSVLSYPFLPSQKEHGYLFQSKHFWKSTLLKCLSWGCPSPSPLLLLSPWAEAKAGAGPEPSAPAPWDTATGARVGPGHKFKCSLTGDGLGFGDKKGTAEAWQISSPGV